MLRLELQRVSLFHGVGMISALHVGSVTYSGVFALLISAAVVDVLRMMRMQLTKTCVGKVH